VEEFRQQRLHDGRLRHRTEHPPSSKGTGEILAEFAIDPAKGYQPKKKNTPDPKTGGVGNVSRHL
jgi:hypothetical protein